MNNVDDNYDSIVGVENSGETNKLNENKDGQLTHKDDEVSRDENYDDIIKNNGDEILEEVECNNGMLVCVDELKREWSESIEVEGLQGVIFSHGVVGGEERSSRVYLVDERSTNNCPFYFGGVPGWTRRCLYDLELCIY